ncbi:MAG TPA: MBL fold metallo-hydrolase [Vicinamibacterales bacterium]|nr:MBL fold metallo-hydrolase [Vicinamibacterales bacterium]
MSSRTLVVAAMITAAAVQGTTIERPAPERVTLGDGVYLFKTAPYGGVGLDGNAVAITSNDGVLVFDSNGTPSAAAAVLAEIRKVSPAPVRYVVNSHWHWDHWYGTEVYQRAFPDVRVIAHEKTRRLMMGPALEFNRPGLESQLPGYIKTLEADLAKAEAATPAPENLPRLRQALADARFFLAQKNAVRHAFPDVTFTDRLTIHFGNREIQLLNFGRAVTPGDTLLYLPAEKILLTGDLIVNPITFALSGYPTEWLAALEKIDALDARTIVTGHGDPLTDETLLHATVEVFRVLLAQGKIMKAKGLDPDQARDAIMPMLAQPMKTITGGVAARENAFRIQLVDWYLHRVYEELDGPLSDAIAALPAK